MVANSESVVDSILRLAGSLAGASDSFEGTAVGFSLAEASDSFDGTVVGFSLAVGLL